jgi:prolyl 4-hydroxylase
MDNYSILSRSPLVLHLSAWLSSQTCEQIINCTENKLEKRVYSSYAPHLMHIPGSALHDYPLIAEVERKINGLVRVRCPQPVLWSIIKYPPGQTLDVHCDALDINEPEWLREAQESGQHVATLLFYLNKVEFGGETIFPDLSITTTPNPGDGLFFINVQSNGTRDLLSKHASLPNVDCEKWILLKFISTKRYDLPIELLR